MEFPEFCIALLANSPDLPVFYVCASIARHLLGLPAIDTTPITLTSDMLEKCCGVFEGDLPRHTVTQRDGNLYIEEFDATLVPLSETRFFDAQVGVFRQYSHEQGGKYQQMEVDMSFNKFNLERIQDEPSEA